MQAKTRANILIVEDSIAVAKRLETSLDRAGFLVEVAHNGREALKQAQRRPFDLVITDEQMPVMSGRELCKELRADNRYANTPIIFLTAENFENDSDEMERDLRVSGVFHKPFDPTALVNAVKAELSPDRRTQRKTDDAAMERDGVECEVRQLIAPRKVDPPSSMPTEGGVPAQARSGGFNVAEIRELAPPEFKPQPRPANVSKEFKDKLEEMVSSIEAGKRYFMYRQVEKDVDLSALQRFGLSSWKVTGVMAGAYLLLCREIVKADLHPEPTDEIIEYLREVLVAERGHMFAFRD